MSHVIMQVPITYTERESQQTNHGFKAAFHLLKVKYNSCKLNFSNFILLYQTWWHIAFILLLEGAEVDSLHV